METNAPMRSKVKIMTEITENDDNYSWRELNCFYKPIAILSKSYNPAYFDIFLFYTSYYESFNVDGRFSVPVNPPPILYPTFFGFFEQVLENKLNLRFAAHVHSSEQDFHEKIRAEIDREGRVLVPGNLYALYYDEHYKKEDHGHYFIIKGYDAEREIYYILDTVHVDGGFSRIYKNFSISFSGLAEVNQCYFERFFNRKVYHFWSMHETASAQHYSYEETLLDHFQHLKQLQRGEAEICHWEHDVAQMLQTRQQSADFDALAWTMAVSANFKTIYYDKLFHMLSRLGADPQRIQYLLQLKNAVSNDWGKIRHELSKLIYKYSKGDIDISPLLPDIEGNLDQEARFRDALMGLIHELGLEVQLEAIRSRQRNAAFSIQNGQYAKLSRDNGIITFNHSPSSVCNIWSVQDSAPQLLVAAERKQNFSLACKVEVRTLQESNYYRCGIIIRLKDGTKLLFGIVRGETIDLLCPELEEKNNLRSEPFFGGAIYLKVEHSSEDYQFHYRYKTDLDWVLFYKGSFDAETRQFGLYTSTWEAMALEVEFSETQLSIDSERLEDAWMIGKK